MHVAWAIERAVKKGKLPDFATMSVYEIIRVLATDPTVRDKVHIGRLLAELIAHSRDSVVKLLEYVGTFPSASRLLMVSAVSRVGLGIPDDSNIAFRRLRVAEQLVLRGRRGQSATGVRREYRDLTADARELLSADAARTDSKGTTWAKDYRRAIETALRRDDGRPLAWIQQRCREVAEALGAPVAGDPEQAPPGGIIDIFSRQEQWLDAIQKERDEISVTAEEKDENKNEDAALRSMRSDIIEPYMIFGLMGSPNGWLHTTLTYHDMIIDACVGMCSVYARPKRSSKSAFGAYLKREFVPFVKAIGSPPPIKTSISLTETKRDRRSTGRAIAQAIPGLQPFVPDMTMVGAIPDVLQLNEQWSQSLPYLWELLKRCYSLSGSSFEDDWRERLGRVPLQFFRGFGGPDLDRAIGEEVSS